jgi:integrase
VPIYQDKKTKRLFIQFQLHGETYKERLPEGITRKKAETIEVKVKSQMLFDQHGIETAAKNQTFERFIQDVYLPTIDGRVSKDSFEKAIYVCKAALPFFKGKQMRQIKPKDIEQFQRSREDAPTMHGRVRQPSTIHRELSIISKIFSLAVRNDLCEYNPCQRVDKPKFDNTQNRVLKKADEKRFLAALPSEWVREVCIVVLNTGLRMNDVMGLTRFQCRMDEGWIWLTQGKTKRKVEVRINAAVRPILEKRIAKYKDGILFPSPRTGKAGSVRHTMQRTCEKLGLDPLTIRDLRRTFGTRIQPLVDTVTAARMMGHSDLRSIHRYQRSLEMMEKATDSLAESPHSLPAAKLRKIK